MKSIWAWVAGITVSVCILGLLVGVRATQKDQRAAYVVIRGTTEQRAEAKTPPGHWLLVRRIPRPVWPLRYHVHRGGNVMRRRALLSVALLAGTVLALGACLGAPNPTPVPATAVASAAQAVQETKSQFALAGTEWQVEAMGGPEAPLPVISAAYPSLGFGVDRYTGYGGCDWFLGIYSATGDSLHMQAPATTTAGCVSEPRIADQQATYMSMLWNVTNYATKDGKLVLYTAGKQPLMTMAPLEAVPFEGTTWELISYFSPDHAYWTALLPGAAITAQFDGKLLTGNAGCNNYQVPYQRTENRLRLEELTVTDKTCAVPEGVMEQEKGYLALLRTVGAISQFPRSIELLASDGTPRLAYHARPQVAP